MTPGLFQHWARLPQSVYSRALYHQLRYAEQGIGLGFIAAYNFLIMTLAIIYVITVRQPIEALIAQIPDWRIEEGRLLVPEGSPPVQTIMLPLGISQFALAHISVDSADTAASTAPVQLNADGVRLIRGEKVQYWPWAALDKEPFFLSEAESAALGATVKGWLRQQATTLYTGFGLFCWATLILIFTLYRSVQALIFGILLSLIAPFFAQKIDWRSGMRMAGTALLPLIVLELFIPLPMPVFTLLALGWCAFWLKQTAA